MMAEANTTVRNAGLLVVQQGAIIVNAFLYAALVPHFMGPDAYGRYTLITSLSIWFVSISGLGLGQIMGRYVPQFVLEGRDLKGFLERFLTVRLLSGALAAILYLVLILLWLRDLDRLVLVIVAVMTFAQVVASFCFTLFLGLNQAARWGMGQVIRGWVSLLLLLSGFYLGGLRGACLGLLLAELIVLAIGLWWARSYLAWPRLRLDMRYLAPYLRFGLIFFASDVLVATSQRGGQTMVRAVSGDYAQVGYFGAAYNVYLTLALALSQLILAFAPLFTSLLAQGQVQALKGWIERLLKWLAVGGMLVLFAVLLLWNDLVPLVLGAAYRPVAVNLLPLTLAVLMLALGSVARLLALVYDRPGVALEAAGVQLAAFVVFGPLLIAWQGSLGGCLAFLAALMLSGVYSTWRMRRVARYSLRGWALVIALGGLFLPLAWLRSSWTVNVALYGAFLVGYGVMLLLLRVVTLNEIRAAWQAIRLTGKAESASRASLLSNP